MDILKIMTEVIYDKYLTLIPAAKKDKQLWKRYDEMFDKLTHLVKIRNNNLDDYVYKNMKIRINSFYDLTLEKVLKLYNVVLLVRSVFKDKNKTYPLVFLEKCLYME